MKRDSRMQPYGGMKRHSERIWDGGGRMPAAEGWQVGMGGRLLEPVMIFFVMSLAGWLWEVGLHLLGGGGFVNRGTLHGPWLPIYGLGSILILALPRRLRDEPLLEFLAIVVLCGCMEYFASWLLERLYDRKWWDYSDYALNLNGRICVEGLLAFGLGGMAMVYILAPFLCRACRRIPRKGMIAVCAVLAVLFCIDLACSVREPNAGRGVTAATAAGAKRHPLRSSRGCDDLSGKSAARVSQAGGQWEAGRDFPASGTKGEEEEELCWRCGCRRSISR